MPTAEDITKQKKQADEQIKAAERMASKERDLLRQQIATIDSEMAELRARRSQVQADLSKLGSL